MTLPDPHTLDLIKSWIWSGFYDLDDIQQMLEDAYQPDADFQSLLKFAKQEFGRKRLAEKSWPAETDCDRLDAAFEALNSSGILALHAAGESHSDGVDEVADLLDEYEPGFLKGYCFYHAQDLAQAVAQRGLSLSFGDIQGESDAGLAAGRLITHFLTAHQLAPVWDGTLDARIHLPHFRWERRSPFSA